MAIKNAEYQIKESGGFNVYHYTTNSGAVKILDSNKNILGTLHEFSFEGKVVESGSFKDLKISGLYKIKSVSGLPEDIPSGKIALLQVKAVGKINTPEFINYQVIYPGGTIYNKTIIGSTESSWSNGGTKLENTITTLLSNFGELSGLNTETKGSLVNALNEVNTNLNTTKNTLEGLNTSFVAHNHDSRYIKKDGDDILGDINIPSTKGFYAKLSSGELRNLISTQSNGDLQVGNAKSVLNLYSTNNLLHNGKKIWTEVNDGDNSGLDADLLDGLHGSDYAKSSTTNTFTESNVFNKNVSIKGNIGLGDKLTVFSDSNNDFNINTDSSIAFNFRVDKEAKIHANSIYFDDGSVFGENRLVWGDTTGDSIGFLRNPVYKNELWMYHWAKQGTSGSGRFFWANPIHNTINFDKEISISGRRVFMQSNQPTSNLEVGSIWIQ